MFNVAVSIWNQIAESSELKTDWAKKMFQMDEYQLDEAQEMQGGKMEAAGFSNSVILGLPNSDTAAIGA